MRESSDNHPTAGQNHPILERCQARHCAIPPSAESAVAPSWASTDSICHPSHKRTEGLPTSSQRRSTMTVAKESLERYPHYNSSRMRL